MVLYVILCHNFILYRQLLKCKNADLITTNGAKIKKYLLFSVNPFLNEESYI